MQMLIDGVLVDVTDDGALLPALERRAAVIIGATNKFERIRKAEGMLVQASYLAAKFGALCAQIVAKPDLPVDQQILFEFADGLGQMAGFNFTFSQGGTNNVEAEEAANGSHAGPAAGAGSSDAERGGAGSASAGERDLAGSPGDGGGSQLPA